MPDTGLANAAEDLRQDIHEAETSSVILTSRACYVAWLIVHQPKSVVWLARDIQVKELFNRN